MPLYSFECKSCGAATSTFRSVDERNDTVPCACGGEFVRVFDPAHNAAIPGIYNRVNRHWNESGKPLEQEYADVLTQGEDG